MNILFLTDGIYPFAIGGMQKHAYYLVKNFAHTKHSLTIFTTNSQEIASEDIAAKLFPEGIPPNIHIQFISTPLIPNFPGHYLIQSWIYSKKITHLIESSPEKFDLILAKGFTAWHLLLNRKSINIPVISQLHGLEMFQPSFSIKDWFVKFILRMPARAIIKNSDYILSYGGKIKQLLLDTGKSESQIIEQYGGIDAFWLEPKSSIYGQSGSRKFLFVARYEYRKGYHILKSALIQLQKMGIWPEIHFVGIVPEKEQLKATNYIYHGNQTAETIRELSDKCDCLLVPSLAEGFPTILVEAMSRGLCPIASDVGAVSAVVEGNNGWLIKPGNVKSLVNAIVLANSITKQELDLRKLNAKSMVLEKFNWINLFETLLLQLENISDDNRKRSSGKESK